MTSSVLGYVILNQQTFKMTTEDVADGGLLRYRKFLNTGEVLAGGSAVPGGGAIDTCVGGEVVPFLAGWVGKPITEDWVECSNPFGSRINFSLKTQSGTAVLNTGVNNGAGANVILELEIKVLPDPIKGIRDY